MKTEPIELNPSDLIIDLEIKPCDLITNFDFNKLVLNLDIHNIDLSGLE